MKKKITFFAILVVLIFLSFILKNNYTRLALWLYPNQDNRNAELLKILLSIIGGLGVLFGLYISLRRAKTTEESVRLQSKAIDKQSEQILLATKSQIDERFSSAIEHLGSDKEPVILGGIAELNQIAQENPNEYSQTVFRILCSYIRSNTNIYKKNADDINHAAVQTIIDYLFKSSSKFNRLYEHLNADLSHSNLLGVDLNNCNFFGADFSFSFMPHLENVNLDNSTIDKTEFLVSTIRNVSLINAKIFQAKFDMCTMENVQFENSSSCTLSFIECELRNVSFRNSNLYNCQFIASLLSNIEWKDSEITSSSFAVSIILDTLFNLKMIYKIDFRGVGFQNVKFVTESESSKFNGSYITDKNYRTNFETTLSKRQSQKAEINPILDFNDGHILQNDFDSLEQNEVDEIKQAYQTLKSSFKALKPSIEHQKS